MVAAAWFHKWGMAVAGCRKWGMAAAFYRRGDFQSPENPLPANPVVGAISNRQIKPWPRVVAAIINRHKLRKWRLITAATGMWGERPLPSFAPQASQMPPSPEGEDLDGAPTARLPFIPHSSFLIPHSGKSPSQRDGLLLQNCRISATSLPSTVAFST